MIPVFVLLSLAAVPSVTVPTGVTVSFASQGAEALRAMTGKRVTGVGLESVVMCSDAAVRVSAGRIYQLAVAHAITPIDPGLAEALVKRRVGLSFYTVFPDILGDGASGIAVLGAAKVISMSTPWLVGLTAASGVLAVIEKQIRSHAPDPTPLLKSLLEPEAVINFAEPGCQKAMMVVRYRGHKRDNSDGAWELK